MGLPRAVAAFRPQKSRRRPAGVRVTAPQRDRRALREGRQRGLDVRRPPGDGGAGPRSSRSAARAFQKARAYAPPLCAPDRIGLLQARSAAVELVGERFQLVTGLDPDAMIERALRSARRRPQRAIGVTDAPARTHSPAPTARGRRAAGGRAQDRRMQRGEGFGCGCSTNTNQPSGAMAANEVSTGCPPRRARRRIPRALRARGAALRGPRAPAAGPRSSSQDQAMSGWAMSAQRVDDVGVARFPDLDARHHVPDELRLTCATATWPPAGEAMVI